MAHKMPKVYACKVKPGEKRKGCGGGATVVEIDKLKGQVAQHAAEIAKLKAEAKRKEDAGKALEKRAKNLKKAGDKQQKRDKRNK